MKYSKSPLILCFPLAPGGKTITPSLKRAQLTSSGCQSFEITSCLNVSYSSSLCAHSFAQDSKEQTLAAPSGPFTAQLRGRQPYAGRGICLTHTALWEVGTNPDWELGLNYREGSHPSFFSSYSHKLFPFNPVVGITLVLNLKIKHALPQLICSKCNGKTHYCVCFSIFEYLIFPYTNSYHFTKS